MFKNSENGYGIVTKLFHWFIGPTIIYLLYLGYTMSGMEKSPEKWESYATHKSLGILVLVLSLVFYSWRLFNKKPKALKTMTRSQIIISNLVKYSLLSIMFLYPLTGYLMSASGGHKISFFGQFEVPLLIEKGQELFGQPINQIAHSVHGYLLYITIGLLVLHIGGALYHQFIKKDDILPRMTYKNIK